MSTALAKRPPQTVADVEERNRLVKKLIVRNASDDQLRLVLGLCDRYGLDPLLKHVVVVNDNVFFTRDGLLRIAHASGQFNGMRVTRLAKDEAGFWEATVAVHRKDMDYPFEFTACEAEYTTGKGAWAKYRSAMTIKVAASMGLRHGFDVSVGAADEIGYDDSTGATALGEARVVEVREQSPPAPAPPQQAPGGQNGRWTVERAVVAINDARRSPEERRKLAQWIFSKQPDEAGLKQYYGAIDQALGTPVATELYWARAAALGIGPDEEEPAPAEEPVEATFTAAPAVPERRPLDEVFDLASRLTPDGVTLRDWLLEHERIDAVEDLSPAEMRELLDRLRARAAGDGAA